MTTDYEIATRYCCGGPMEYAGETTITREAAGGTTTTTLPITTQKTQDKMVCRVCGRMCWVTRG
jgi:hypothetical protein